MKELNYKDVAKAVMDSIAKEKGLLSYEWLHTDTFNHEGTIVYLFSYELDYIKYFVEVSVIKNNKAHPIVSYYTDSTGILNYYEIDTTKEGKIEAKKYARDSKYHSVISIEKLKKMITEVYFPKLLEQYTDYASLQLQAYIGHIDCNAFSDDYYFLVRDDKMAEQYILCFKHLKYLTKGSNTLTNNICMHNFDSDYYSEATVSEDLKGIDFIDY